MRDRWRVLGLVLGLLAGLLTLVGGRWGLPLHDLVGRTAASPELPVLLVEVQTTPAQAAETVGRAGATSVQMALPEGHPLLAGAPAERLELREGSDGRLRWSDEGRLPLPEAVDSIRRMSEDQLEGLGESQPLRGLHVVLVFGVEGLGRTVLVPGLMQPVDRGIALAVAQGAVAADRHLGALPLPLAAALVAFLAGLLVPATRRTTPTSVWRLVGAGVGVVLLLSVVARSLGWDLPLGGLLVACVLPLPLRLVIANLDTLDVLDGLSLRVEGLFRWTEEAAGPLAGLPELLALSHPELRVTAWTGAAGESAKFLAAAGPAGRGVVLERIPEEALGDEERHVEPVYEQGRLVGALMLEGPGRRSEVALRHARVVARRSAWAYGGDEAAAGDPFRTRLQVLRRSLVRTVQTTATWQDLFAGGPLPIGVFSASGDLVAGSPRLKQLVTPGEASPMVSVLKALLVDEALVAQALRGLQGSPSSQRHPLVEGRQSLVLTPLVRGEATTGVFLQVLELAQWTSVDGAATGPGVHELGRPTPPALASRG